MSLTAADIVVRIANDEASRDTANSFATLEELDRFIRFRMDADLWASVDEELRVRAAVSAYRDLVRLPWSSSVGLPQNRDIEFSTAEDGDHPPLHDRRFRLKVKEAQAAQVMFILAGTQVRDMAREGVRFTKTLMNSEMEITGYRGAVGAEAREIISPWIETAPRSKRMQ